MCALGFGHDRSRLRWAQPLKHLGQLTDYVWLGVAVLIGGQVGSRLSTRVLSGRVVKRLTAALVLYAAGRLLYLSFAGRIAMTEPTLTTAIT